MIKATPRTRYKRLRECKHESMRYLKTYRKYNFFYCTKCLIIIGKRHDFELEKYVNTLIKSSKSNLQEEAK